MEIYVLQTHILHDGTYTEGVTLSQTVAENWEAESPFNLTEELQAGYEWRSYEAYTPIEDLT